jgi:NAD(P)-dependent dehydrogenase (short-subunit alcohol dehydrogenase family)
VSHPALAPGRVAVVTGAASGIGLAACQRFASMGLKVAMADVDGARLDAAAPTVAALAAGGTTDVLTRITDVGVMASVELLRDAVYDAFGDVAVLMNNAAGFWVGRSFEDLEAWRRTIAVNLLGVVHGQHAFVPRMIAQGTPAVVVNTGSKQGITNPPGNAAYNAAKAAVKSLTEGLQHELRNLRGCRVSAHLLVPGWTTTGTRQHQPGAWLPEQVADHLVTSLERGDFYILCPDDEVTPAMDRKRILWGAGDVTENRPPLSRWHPDWAETFETWEP